MDAAYDLASAMIGHSRSGTRLLNSELQQFFGPTDGLVRSTSGEFATGFLGRAKAMSMKEM